MTRGTGTLPGWAIWSALILLHATSAETSSPNTGDQLQAFRFQYTSTVPQLPIQYTCPSPFTLTQSTPTNNGGPDPVAPYTMISFVHEQLMDGSGVGYERIYARSLVVGDMSKSVSFSHPWANGTQHISCIWAVSHSFHRASYVEKGGKTGLRLMSSLMESVEDVRI